MEAAGADATAMGREYMTSYRRLPFSLLALSRANSMATSRVNTPTRRAKSRVLPMIFGKVEEVITLM